MTAPSNDRFKDQTTHALTIRPEYGPVACRQLENGPVSLHYETWGEGPDVLLLAPGGLRASRIETWANAPWNPIEALADRYRVIGDGPTQHRHVVRPDHRR